MNLSVFHQFDFFLSSHICTLFAPQWDIFFSLTTHHPHTCLNFTIRCITLFIFRYFEDISFILRDTFRVPISCAHLRSSSIRLTVVTHTTQEAGKRIAYYYTNLQMLFTWEINKWLLWRRGTVVALTALQLQFYLDVTSFGRSNTQIISRPKDE